MIILYMLFKSVSVTYDNVKYSMSLSKKSNLEHM